MCGIFKLNEKSYCVIREQCEKKERGKKSRNNIFMLKKGKNIFIIIIYNNNNLKEMEQ